MTIGRENTAGAPVVSSAGYDAFETITSFAPAAIARRNGSSSVAGSETAWSSVFSRRGAEAGKVLGGRGDPAGLERADEGRREAADLDASEPKERLPRKPPGRERVRDRREVDVDAGGA